MKRFGKTGIAFLLMTLMIAAFAVNASAATISDGIKAEIEVISQSGDKASVNAVVKNANYYAIDGINCKLSVSDNAVLSGEDVKTDLTLLAEQSEKLTAEIGLKNIATTQPSETQSTETPS